MKCPNCDRDMDLRRCVGNGHFVYECDKCGIVVSPTLQLLCEPQLDIKLKPKEKQQQHEN